MNNIDNELEKMKHLMGFNMNENKSNGSKTIVEYSAKASDGKTYGIIREGTKFYIKVAPKKDTQIISEDYDYIGGYMNKKEYEYPTYSSASKNFDLKLMSIDEACREKSNNKKINESKNLNESAEWQSKDTQEMRSEIKRLQQITENVNTLLENDANKWSGKHSLPEAPATHTDPKTSNGNPYTEKADGNAYQDFDKTNNTPKTQGKPFDKKVNVTNANMQSDKAPKGKSDVVYTEKAKYAPDGATTTMPKKTTGKAIKVTESQVLAWNREKDYMDTSHGTKVGSSAPFTKRVEKGESNQPTAGENLHEDVLGWNDDPNYMDKSHGTKIGSSAPYTKRVEASVSNQENKNNDAINNNGHEDDALYEVEINEDINTPWEETVGGNSKDVNIEPKNKLENNLTSKTYDINGQKFEIIDSANEDQLMNGTSENGTLFGEGKVNLGYKPKFPETMTTMPNNDGGNDIFNDESAKKSKRSTPKAKNTDPYIDKIVESVLNDFGKHPAYQKQSFTTPKNNNNSEFGEDWNDDSVEGEKPYGTSKGKTIYNKPVKHQPVSQNNHNVSETKLNVFGKHPAYQKTAFTTPKNADGSQWGEDWNDESTKGEQPYGRSKGNPAPFSKKVVDSITNEVMDRILKKK